MYIALTTDDHPFPWPWEAACLHLDFHNHGYVQRFPEGTYNQQVASAYGRLQLRMMRECWNMWADYNDMGPLALEMIQNNGIREYVKQWRMKSKYQ